MARKSYKSQTLNGNWYEERAPPLNGVIADYGIRTNDCQPRSRADFIDPEKHSISSAHGGIHRLLTTEYLERIADNKSSSIPEDDWVGRLPRHHPDFNKRYFETTSQKQFGVAPRETKRAEKMRSAVPAGAPTKQSEKAQRQTGACGELLRTHSDPQNNTAAQRSWLYNSDPALEMIENPPPERTGANFMSLQLGDNSTTNNNNSYARQTSHITKRHGAASKTSGIWADA